MATACQFAVEDAAQLPAMSVRLAWDSSRAFTSASWASAASTANWHAVAARTTRVQAHRAMRLAEALEDREHARAALAQGRIHVDQAEAILRALVDLPAGLDPDLAPRAEQHLVELAGDHDAKHLKILGRRILEVIDPAADDAHEARLLEKEERAAQAVTSLVIYDDGRGKVHGRFTLPSFERCRPSRRPSWRSPPPSTEPRNRRHDERRTTPERLGLALLRSTSHRYPATKLPKAGGLNATVLVTLPLETLMGGLKDRPTRHRRTHLPRTGSAPRPPTARLIPAVLGSKSQVLDLGREARRFGSGTGRILKTLEAGGCQVQGLRPATRQVPSPPPHPLGRRRETNRDQGHDLPLAPHPSPRQHLRNHHSSRPGRIAFHRRP